MYVQEWTWNRGLTSKWQGTKSEEEREGGRLLLKPPPALSPMRAAKSLFQT